MTIKIGDQMPTGTFGVMSDNGPAQLTSAELFGGKKVVLFSVPGAFTPTCSAKHVPGYVEQFDKFKAAGVDEIKVRSVLTCDSRFGTCARCYGRSTVAPAQ